jgi:AraC-like DNA-binding protein
VFQAIPWTTLLGLLGAAQGLLLAGAAASLGGRANRPNIALATMLAVFSFAVGVITAEHAGLFGPSIFLVLAEITASLAFPPALWHYADTVLGDRGRVPAWVHALPAGVWLAYLVVMTLKWSIGGPPYGVWLPPVAVIVVYLTTYTILVGIRTWRGSSRSRALVAHRGVLRLTIVLLVLLHVAQVVRYVFREVEALSDIVPLTGTFIVYVLSIVALRQSRLFAGHETAALRQKYESSTLDDARIEEIRQRLLEIMERERPYRNENLNLAELAARIKLPRTHLSQVINQHLGTNFPEFLNGYRVKEAARLLGDPEWARLTVEAIGYEVGFRSRSGFHGTFKRLTGETPAQARARMSQKTIRDT